ncbi:MAG: hypothetical protein H7Y33_13745 [Cytophagales bacterium]|nr:hypothetical protein [Rhizobacter sp.]
MSGYQDATVVRQHHAEQADGTELRVHLLHGEGSAEGHSCIHRVVSDRSGQLKSDIVYYYRPSIAADFLNADFDLLASGRLMSVNQLHHSEFMLNRRLRAVR